MMKRRFICAKCGKRVWWWQSAIAMLPFGVGRRRDSPVLIHAWCWLR